MLFTAASIDVCLRSIRIGDVIEIAELRVSAQDVTAPIAKDQGAVNSRDVSVSLTVSEIALNRALQARPTDAVRDMEIALMAGKVRVTGRIGKVRALSLPFAVVAELQTNGSCLLVDPSRVNLLGAPLPGFTLNTLGDRINSQLARVFDTSRWPVQVRLTRVAVEPGRLVVEANSSLSVLGKSFEFGAGSDLVATQE